jgi:hypothetical protein
VACNGLYCIGHRFRHTFVVFSRWDHQERHQAGARGTWWRCSALSASSTCTCPLACPPFANNNHLSLLCPRSRISSAWHECNTCCHRKPRLRFVSCACLALILQLHARLHAPRPHSCVVMQTHTTPRYAMRVNLSVAAIEMADDHHWCGANVTAGKECETTGTVLGSFFYGYICTQVQSSWCRNAGSLIDTLIHPSLTRLIHSLFGLLAS